MTTTKTDSRGRIRFGKYGFRFETTVTDPTKVTVYDRFGGKEVSLGTIDLFRAAITLANPVNEEIA